MLRDTIHHREHTAKNKKMEFENLKDVLSYLIERSVFTI